MNPHDYEHFAANLDDDAGIANAINSVASPARSTRASGLNDDIFVDTHRNAPRPDPACLYGLVGDVAQAGSANTEANPFAIAAAMLAYLGAAVGRGPYMPIGDDWNHARLFMVHVGRSSRGRKGTAKKLIYRINNAVKALDEFLVPQVHRGGLSTREGLALMIHDGYKESKNEVPAITDKRLLVVESEFANILHQSKRDGNTLSAALRDAWDGTSIRPAVKTCRVWASDPHIGIIGDVTPSELRELMHARELTNGFANRFIFFWAEGDKVLPFPQYTPKHVVEALGDRLAQILRFAGADRHVDMDVMRMEFSPEAASLYARLYRGELRDRSAGEHITGLLDRRAPVLLRLAMLFALTDQTKDCFGSHVSKATLDKALDELITASPPAIEVETVPRPNGQPGSPSKVYKPCATPAHPASAANSANSAQREAPWAFAAGFGAARNLRNLLNVERNEGAAETQKLPEVAQFAESAIPLNPALTRMDIDTSQDSHSSHAQSGNPNADDVEVF